MGRQKGYEQMPTSGRSIRLARSPLENRNVRNMNLMKNGLILFALIACIISGCSHRQALQTVEIPFSSVDHMSIILSFIGRDRDLNLKMPGDSAPKSMGANYLLTLHTNGNVATSLSITGAIVGSQNCDFLGTPINILVDGVQQDIISAFKDLASLDKRIKIK